MQMSMQMGFNTRTPRASLQPMRASLQPMPVRCMAGHSKWHNIRHKKGKNDALRNKLFTKLCSAIANAARAGGPNADENLALAAAIEKARQNNVPKDRIQNAIKASERPRGEYVLFDVRGLGKAGILVEGESDNVNRMKIDLNIALKKTNVAIASKGSVASQFERKGVIQLPASCIEEDSLFEMVAEAGAEDVLQVAMQDKDGAEFMVYEVITSFADYAAVSKVLESSQVAGSILEETSGLLMIPHEHFTVALEQDDFDANMEAIEKL